MPNAKRVARSSNVTQTAAEKKKSEEFTCLSTAEFYEREDKEAMSLDFGNLEKTFLEHSAAIREKFARLAAKKHEGVDLANLGDSILSRLISMRRLNRLAQYRNRKRRDEAAQDRCAVDERFLQLQNINNEIEHIQKEIARCYEFRSADEDIELVPVEEFYSTAPSSVSQKEITKGNAHEQRLARLNWEMVERKNLVGTLQEREGRKNVLLSDISTKEHRLQSLKPKINAIMEAAKPVQDLMVLGEAEPASEEKRKMLSFLPKELALVAILTEAFSDIAEEPDVNVDCDGDLESALKFSESVKKSNDSDDDDDGSHKQERNGSSSPVPRLKRRRSTVTEQIAKKSDLVLAPHPISLIIRVKCEGAVTASLIMHYLPELRAIAVKAKLTGSSLPFLGNLLCEETLLMELFPGDFGEKCPNDVGQVKLEHLRLNVSDYESKVGRMYGFAQRMAAIGEEKAESARLCDIVQSVVSELRNRVRSRCELIDSVRRLQSLKVFEEMRTADRNRFPSKILSRLTDFRMLTFEEFFGNANVDNEYRSLIERPVENQFYFGATIERSPGARLTAFIFVGVGYPKRSRPLFILNFAQDETKLPVSAKLPLSAVRDLERELNVGSLSLLGGSECDGLLFLQIAFLMSRLDVLLEIHSSYTGSNVCSKEHLFARLARGRDRHAPMFFNSATETFTFYDKR